MMKQINAVYRGMKDNKYLFESQELRARNMSFNKANRSLIDDFDLNGKKSVGQLFKLKYFIEEISDRDIYILCDMEKA
jgi:hypothetical protein